jgi:hypothetical protein
VEVVLGAVHQTLFPRQLKKVHCENHNTCIVAYIFDLCYTLSMKRSTMPNLSNVAAKVLSFYYGNPAKDLRLIVVASDVDSPLPELIHNIVTAAGEKSAVVSAKTAVALQRALSKTWKKGTNVVVISAPLKALAGLPVDVLLTDRISAPASVVNGVSKMPNYLVLNRDDLSYPALKDTRAAKSTKSYGHHREADTRVDSFKPYRTAIEARLSLGNRVLDVAAYLTGEPAPGLLAAAATVADILGIERDVIVEGLAAYEPGVGKPVGSK